MQRRIMIRKKSTISKYTRVIYICRMNGMIFDRSREKAWWGKSWNVYKMLISASVQIFYIVIAQAIPELWQVNAKVMFGLTM